MFFLELDEVLAAHQRTLRLHGGADGIRDRGALESALAQPSMTFGGVDLYPGIVEKVAALGYSLVMNHPFVDGNKRVGHASMVIFLGLNGLEIRAPHADHERVILSVASGGMTREAFVKWLAEHVHPRP